MGQCHKSASLSNNDLNEDKMIMILNKFDSEIYTVAKQSKVKSERNEKRL